MLVRRECSNQGSKAYKNLGQHFRSTGKPRIMTIMGKLTNLRMNGGENINDYIVRAEELSYALEDAGQQVGETMLVSLVLKGLPDSFETFVTIQNCIKENLEYEKVKKDLINFVNNKAESETPKGLHDVAAFSKDARAKVGCQGKCFNCDQSGHMSQKCPKGKAVKKQECSNCGKKNHSFEKCYSKGGGADKTGNEYKAGAAEHSRAFAFTVTNSASLVSREGRGVELLVDSGCTNYMFNDRRFFVRFDGSFKSSVKNANKSSTSVEGIGKVEVLARAPDGGECTLTFDDALLVPSYLRSLVSV